MPGKKRNYSGVMTFILRTETIFRVIREMKGCGIPHFWMRQIVVIDFGPHRKRLHFWLQCNFQPNISFSFTRWIAYGFEIYCLDLRYIDASQNGTQLMSYARLSPSACVWLWWRINNHIQVSIITPIFQYVKLSAEKKNIQSYPKEFPTLYFLTH